MATTNRRRCMATAGIKKKKISTQSAKAKGRNLQKWVVAELLKRYPQLTDMDLRSCPMGSHGADIVMSQLAQNEIPANFECKSLAKAIFIIIPLCVVKLLLMLSCQILTQLHQ